MLSIKVKGSWSKTISNLQKIKKTTNMQMLNKYGSLGVKALSLGTPKDTGLTATSWGYRIEEIQDGYKIVWTNSHVENGVNIAVILQYGHGTGTGGYVAGIDYINPALKPVFDEIADSAWKEIELL